MHFSLNLVLYFDRIPLWGKFVTTILVGLLVGLGVMFIVKPRLRKSIEGEQEIILGINHFFNVVFVF